MLISFVIPVYNGQNYIVDCVKSITTIERRDIEIIIVNDGSTDETASILQELVLCDSRVIVVHQNNSGVSRARNVGIKNAKGKYIVFVDCDDAADSNLNDFINVIERTNRDLYLSNYIIKDGSVCTEFDKVSVFKSQMLSRCDIIDALLDGKSNNVWANAYRKDIIDRYKLFFPEGMRIGEDAIFNLNYAKHIENALVYGKSIYIYNMNNNQSAMHQYRIGDIIDYVNLFDSYNDVKCLGTRKQFDGREAHYLSRIFGCLYYTDEIVNRDLDEKFRCSYLYKRLIQAHYNNAIGKIKKQMIVVPLYRVAWMRGFIKLFMN